MDITQSMLLFVATMLGAVTTAVLGWAKSGEAFDARKFASSLIRGIIAAILVFISTYEGFAGEITFFTYLAAYISGGFFDVTINRLSGIVQNSENGNTAAPAQAPAVQTPEPAAAPAAPAQKKQGRPKKNPD